MMITSYQHGDIPLILGLQDIEFVCGFTQVHELVDGDIELNILPNFIPFMHQLLLLNLHGLTLQVDDLLL